MTTQPGGACAAPPRQFSVDNRYATVAGFAPPKYRLDDARAGVTPATVVAVALLALVLGALVVGGLVAFGPPRATAWLRTRRDGSGRA